MDGNRFDELARNFWELATRRRLLLRLGALPAVTAIAARFSSSEEVSAAHPGHRLQDRKQKHHDHARRRRKHRRDTKRRDNGKSGGRGNQGAGQTCVPLDQVCSLFGTKCCEPASCLSTGIPLLSTCQLDCKTTEECQRKLKTKNVHCQTTGPTGCHGGVACCRPNECATSFECDGDMCCPTLPVGILRCCGKGQHCAPGGGCATN